MNIKYLFIINVLLLTASGCEKWEEDYEKFYWEQTACMDPWGAGQNDSNSETRAAITEYLKKEGVDVIGVSFEESNQNGLYCNACHCVTGKIIKIQVEESDREKMIDLKFREN